MDKQKKHIPMIIAALMAGSVSVPPALAEDNPSVSESQEVLPSTSKSSPNTDLGKDSSISSFTENEPDNYTPEEQESLPQVEITPGQAKATISNGRTDLFINTSYSGLMQGGEYQTQLTIKDKNGNIVDDRNPKRFTAYKDKGNTGFSLSFDGILGRITVSLDLVDKDKNIVASANPVEIDIDEGQGHNSDKAYISTTASLNTESIQTGSMVSDTISYSGFVPGEKYTVESSLVCKLGGRDTGSYKTGDFTAENTSGTYTVEGIEVKDTDCFKQVVFEIIKDKNGTVVAEHKDLFDRAQTVGDEFFAKKKKDIDSHFPLRHPIRRALRNSNDDTFFTPFGSRAVIGSVPSGELSNYGSTLFNR